MAWGQWGARPAEDAKTAPAPVPLTPPPAAPSQPPLLLRQPQRAPATPSAPSPPPAAFASPPANTALGARPARHAAPSGLMGAPMRVCKPAAAPPAAPFVAPLASASHAGVAPPSAYP